MKLFKILALLFFCIILSNCNEANETKKEIKKNNIENSIPLKKELNYLIRENGVLDLNLNDIIPNKIENFKIVKSTKIMEEGDEEPVINLIENNTQILEISLKYDDEKQKFINQIGEFLIKSNIFKTKEKIGVDSTIKDFIKVYPKYRIWYTYISDSFVIEFKKSRIQFLLENKGYIGKKDLMESDGIELKLEDFLPNTKIKEIRIYDF